MLLKYNVNTCDQIASEVMVHFTKYCENKCRFCIDATNKGIKLQKPDVESIFNTINSIKDKITDVTISGGEPCLYLEELYDLVKRIKEKTNLNVGIMSSLPTTCWVKRDLFFTILDMIDNFSFSPQHYNEEIADKIRGCKSKYNHQELYRIMPHKEKMCVNINLIKGLLEEKDDVLSCIKHYNDLGYKNIRLAELFEKEDMFVPVENIFDVKLNPPFACGCRTQIDAKKWIPSFNGKLTLKRACFMVNKKRHATLRDLLKIVTRNFFAKDYNFGVIYENGKLMPYWC